jgi:sugar-specific transcriptional regulator TrmB
MTLELLLAEQGPMTAQELSRRLQKPIEDVYERLVSLEGKDMVRLSWITPKQRNGQSQFKWAMA